MSNPVKLAMRTPSLADKNFAALAALFPNAVTETMDENGAVVRAIDKDVLAQEINAHVVEGREERYQFTWPDKRKSILLANAPIAAALRPCREESVNFDTTENLYIEGDNLDVLKLLRETYLNRVKMIYIDPPYNTGKDFVYKDDFAEDTGDFLRRDGQYDEQGNRLSTNLDSNGRFHTDWLNMLYPRLRLAKDLLTEDGVIFVSIADTNNATEASNVSKICNEIFGERNFLAQLIWNKQHSQQQGVFKVYHEYIFVYAKNKNLQGNIGGGSGIIEAGALKKVSAANPKSNFTFPVGVRFDAPDGTLLTGEYGDAEKVEVIEGRLLAKGGKTAEQVTLAAGWTQKNQMKDFFAGKAVWDTKEQKVIEFFFTSTGKLKCLKERTKITPETILPKYGTVSASTAFLTELMGANVFDVPKPLNMLQDFVGWFTKGDDMVLDFFSGSATTAHAVMQLNAEDGAKRKFIMVQIPELCAEDSEAAKAGYANICEIGKKRIRCAGERINKKSDLIAKGIDIGFRVLKLDSSNMKDVYYTPEEYAKMGFDLSGFKDNIKKDRSDEDLLFQVMLDLGIPLSAKIRQVGDVYYVNDTYLIACFKQVDTALITEIAKQKPYYSVFRDSSFTSDSAMVNFEQVFNTYSPNTIRRVL